MTATIRPAALSDLEAVSAYCAGTMRGHGGAARYRRYFEYSWLRDKPDLGVLIEDDRRIRGFIGALYSTRNVDGRAYPFCNISSVAVDESHRKLTLKLFGAILGRKDISFTCFSPSDQIAKILDFFRFKHRPGERVIVGPLSGLAGLRRLGRARVVTKTDELDRVLDDEQRTISRDHRGYRCGQLAIVDGDRHCFVVTAKRGHGARVFADVIHASDPEMLVDHLPWIHAPLFRAHRTVLTGIDRRWVAHPPRASFVFAKLRPAYVRSPLPVDVVDALYSELVPASGVV